MTAVEQEVDVDLSLVLPCDGTMFPTGVCPNPAAWVRTPNFCPCRFFYCDECRGSAGTSPRL